MSRYDEDLSACRGFIRTANEAYNVARLPALNRVYDTKGEEPKPVDELIWESNRMKLLQHSIDVKGILDKFMGKLKDEHGSKRANRLRDYLEDAQLSHHSHHRREEIKADTRRLWKVLLEYKKLPR